MMQAGHGESPLSTRKSTSTHSKQQAAHDSYSAKRRRTTTSLKSRIIRKHTHDFFGTNRTYVFSVDVLELLNSHGSSSCALIPCPPCVLQTNTYQVLYYSWVYYWNAAHSTAVIWLIELDNLAIYTSCITDGAAPSHDQTDDKA